MRWTWAEYRVCTAALPEAFRTFVFELASHFHIFSYLLVGFGLVLLYGYCHHLGRAPRVTEDPSEALVGYTSVLILGQGLLCVGHNVALQIQRCGQTGRPR